VSVFGEPGEIPSKDQLRLTIQSAVDGRLILWAADGNLTISGRTAIYTETVPTNEIMF
jgi:hypothetical protein